MGAEESGHWYISYVPPKSVWEGKGVCHHLHKASSPLVLQLQLTNHITVIIKNPSPFLMHMGLKAVKWRRMG